MVAVLLVRHADIDLPPRSANPALSAAGHQRAETLAHVCGGAGVASIFISSFRRTQQTAAPLANGKTS